MRRNGAQSELIEDVGGLGKSPGAIFSAGHVPLGRFDHGDAAGAQGGDIGLGCGVKPHSDIHCRGRDHRLVGREKERGRKVVGNARRVIGVTKCAPPPVSTGVT